MTRDHLQRYEERLLEERSRVLETISDFDRHVVGQPEGDGDLTYYPLHPADEGTDTNERGVSYMLAGQEGRLLQWIDDALRTIYKEPERYGRCEVCGNEIVRDRLELIPWATRCVDHQNDHETEAT